ncbi:unnamed protein product, partial [Ectocarpus sp. 8 AP-2014]
MPSVSGLVRATLLVVWAGLLLLHNESASVKDATGGVPAGDGAPPSAITGGVPYSGDTPSVKTDGVAYSGGPPWTIADGGPCSGGQPSAFDGGVRSSGGPLSAPVNAAGDEDAGEKDANDKDAGGKGSPPRNHRRLVNNTRHLGEHTRRQRRRLRTQERRQERRRFDGREYPRTKHYIP